ncbi:hypothetical protein QZH41_013891 [Actinostola sp. cb2023]|nr:hypothetical protein QZH41_013891 [Actinostola sp. cb2023]
MWFDDSINHQRTFIQVIDNVFSAFSGSFGNGILSFFTFLRWLLYVNLLVFIVAMAFLVIPQAVYTREVPGVILGPPNPANASTNSSTTVRPPINLTLESAEQDIIKSRAGFLGANASVVEWQRHCPMFKPRKNYGHNVGAILSDFMQGMGWINTTVMFYGSYSSQILMMPADSFYNMPLAYFTVGTLSFIIVLLLTLWSASSIIEDSYIKDGVKHYNSYCNKVFGGWDMCIIDENAAKLKVKSFVRELEGDLAEELRLANLSKRTRNQTIKVYTIRFTINVLVLLLSAGAGWAIYEAAQLSLKTAQADVNANSSKIEIIALLKSYASSITLTVLNSALPALFYFLSRLEDWNPRVQVNIDLLRYVTSKYRSSKCWENAIAAEMYKLIWMDFLVVIAVALAYHTPRRYVADNIDLGIKLGQKIGRPIFFIPQNVLELVYGQCLIWIGMWYSPLLTLMGCVKLFILFYVKKLTLKYNCRFEDKAYRAGKSNYFFMLLLLATFFLCVAAVVYGVSQYESDIICSDVPDLIPVLPVCIRGLDRMYRIVPLTIQTLPIGFQDIYEVVQSPVFVIGIVILICLGLYFFYASAKVYSHMIMELREELAMVRVDILSLGKV